MRAHLTLPLLALLLLSSASCTKESAVSPDFEEYASKSGGDECVNGLGRLANGAQYGFAAGHRNGGPRIHIRYQDHKAHINLMGGLPISVTDLGGGRWSFAGTCRIGGVDGYTFEALVTDGGAHDDFEITVSNGYNASEDVTGGYIDVGCQN